MRKLTILVVVLLLTLSVSIGIVAVINELTPEEPPIKLYPVKEPAEYKVMSYNIRLYLPIPDSPEDDWSIRAPLIIKQIKEESPDLLGLQEVISVQRDYIIEELSDTYGYYFVGREDGQSSEGLNGLANGEMLGILYKKDVFEVVETEFIWLSETPNESSFGWDAACKRICITAKLYDKENDNYIYFNCTHLDNRGLIASQNSSEIIADRISAQGEEYPSIVVGDFNYSYTSPAYEIVTEKLVDVAKVAPDAQTTRTYHNYNYDYVDVISGLPIDYIFINEGGFDVLSYEVLNHLVDDEFASDHFAIKAQLRMKRKLGLKKELTN